MNHGRYGSIRRFGGRARFMCELAQQLTSAARTGSRLCAPCRLARNGFENDVQHLPILSGCGRGMEPGTVVPDMVAEVADAAGAALVPDSA
eukprot:1383963-Pleurochrysis_carterae.AAC.1